MYFTYYIRCRMIITPMLLVKNTLVITNKSVSKIDLKIEKNSVTHIVAPFLKEVGEQCFSNFYNLQKIQAPYMARVQKMGF